MYDISIMGTEGLATWKDLVQQAITDLGGQAHLHQINERIAGHPKTRTNPTWKDTIRRVVRQYSIFEPVPPQRSGIYRLVEKPVLREPHRDKATHGTVQGMLLRLGRLYGYDTFAPAADIHSKTFQGQPLVDFTTVTDCSGFCTAKTSLSRVRQIDAIWLQEDNEGPYPAYAFEVEHSTKVKSGMDRLTEIPERYPVPLFIVAPGEPERRLFDRFRAQSRYGRFRERFNFRTYQQLENLFNAAIRHDEYRDSFGVTFRAS
jgi:hypothetical protein